MKQLRILHIVENLDRGAVENWLVRACEIAAGREPGWKWTFYCIVGKPGRLDDRARRFGAEVVYSPHPVGNKIAFLSSMRSFMRSHSHDILHCHHDVMSAVYLWAAWGLFFRRRIVHIHNASQGLSTPSQWKTRLLMEPMRQTCLRLADNTVAISQHTLAKFLNGRTPREGRDLILPVGVDTRPFAAPSDAAEFRRQLGLPASAKILLFVGRMVAYKNPLFILDMLEILARRDSSVMACFVGNGPLVSEVERVARAKSLSDRVRLLGWRDDIAQIMQASNLLVFPNLEDVKEGLGLVVVEAQAAGLPMILSLGATEEAIVVPELANILPLEICAEGWARRAAEILERPAPDRHTCLNKVEASPLSLNSSAAGLMALYR